MMYYLWIRFQNGIIVVSSKTSFYLIGGGYEPDEYHPFRNKSHYSKDFSIVLPKYKKLSQILKQRVSASIVEISEDSLWITGGAQCPPPHPHDSN